MKRAWGFMVVVFLIVAYTGTGNATLTVIGSANYRGENCNLIYEDDSIFGGLVWLDYTNSPAKWENQTYWASELGSELSISLYPGYATSIDWDSGWRLPMLDSSVTPQDYSIGYSGPDVNGKYDYTHGYNMVNSEMGHLFYESLGNKGLYAKDGTYPQPDYGLISTASFENLSWSTWYWLENEYSGYYPTGYTFDFKTGLQSYDNISAYYGIAVNQGEVTVVPEPGSASLFLCCLFTLAYFYKIYKPESHIS